MVNDIKLQQGGRRPGGKLGKQQLQQLPVSAEASFAIVATDNLRERGPSRGRLGKCCSKSRICIVIKSKMVLQHMVTVAIKMLQLDPKLTVIIITVSVARLFLH